MVVPQNISGRSKLILSIEGDSKYKKLKVTVDLIQSSVDQKSRNQEQAEKK